MADADRDRWDARYRERGPECAAPHELLLSLDGLLPRAGRALDVAGGAGRHALWLARRGLDVTLADISPVALELASAQAAREGLALHTVAVDLEQQPLPAGPFDVVVSTDFLFRPLLSGIAGSLAPGGWFAFVQATAKNLERHAHPSRRFLLEDGELPGLVKGLEVVRYEESWSAEGRHEARLVARRGIE